MATTNFSRQVLRLPSRITARSFASTPARRGFFFKEHTKDIQYRPGLLRLLFWLPYRKGPDHTHGWSYRRAIVPPPSSMAWIGEALGALFWTWIVFNFWTDFGHLYDPHHQWQDPMKFTDEELGIPKD